MPARTPLHDRHLAASARMVEFGGYEMPLQYSSMREEHVAVRERAGVFDLSHMGEVRFRGPASEEVVQRLVANDVSKLAPGAALYAVMCNERGGIVDDVIVYRDEEDGFMVVVNAGCREKDVAWMRSHLVDGCAMEDESERIALIAVQGPLAVRTVDRLCDERVDEIPSFQSVHADVCGVRARVSRTGYTGEDGFELYVDAADAATVWDSVLDIGASEGLIPAGLGARDTLRLEAGLRLYGQDMDEETDPFSAALGWTVKLGKGDFVGAEALRALDPKRPPKRFVGLTLEGRAIARHGQRVTSGGSPVGEVTSGTYSFTLGHGIATAYVPVDLDPNAELAVEIRGEAAPARRVALPFYKRQA